MAPNGGAARPYRARATRKMGTAGRATRGLKAYTKATAGGAMRRLPTLPGPTKGRTRPLPKTQRRLPTKQTFPVPPLPGQKTAAGNTKMYPAAKREKRAGRNLYRRRSNRATF